MEQKVSTTLSGLEGELKGKFYPLTGMEKTVQQQLIDDHFLFKVMALIALNETQLLIYPSSAHSRREIVSCRPRTRAATGRPAVASTTTMPRPSWSGAMRRIICASSPCRWAVTWEWSSVA